MKAKVVIVIVVLLGGVGIFLYVTPNKPMWSPWYCKQYSSFHSYARGDKPRSCVEAGCKVNKTKEIDDPDIFDDEGYYYNCTK